MESLAQSASIRKSEFEPVDRMVDRARDAIQRFAGERHLEYLCIRQQFELDLAETECRPDLQRLICSAYIWLAKGL